MAAGSGDPRAGGRKKVPLRLGAAGAARGWRNEKEGGPSLGGRPPAIRSIATRFGLVEMLPSLGDGYFCLSRKPACRPTYGSLEDGCRWTSTPNDASIGRPGNPGAGRGVREERGLRR